MGVVNFVALLKNVCHMEMGLRAFQVQQLDQRLKLCCGTGGGNSRNEGDRDLGSKRITKLTKLSESYT